ncbi:MAG: hypothetical protein ACAH08_02125 [Methylophilus sp.]|jgi:hypothetical protein|uniref:hypothetical protein n=1 Tax=Methylophilus sp. TaxID=29541 RepID=UPI002B721B72|nr:hypothetical protein [Methylophilus sp.]HSH85809.1 hypothetical protein [Methylophilus sp.]
MQKIFYLLHLLCLVFALQTTAAEPVVTTTLLQTGSSAVIMSNATDDTLSAGFVEASSCVDMLEVAEVDVDKITLPAFNYPLRRASHHAPDHHLPAYHTHFRFWLDRPPQLT